MSNEQTKIGAGAILLFMLGTFFAPIVYNLANKADNVPIIATKLEYVGLMVEANTVVIADLVVALKDFGQANIVEHRAIVDALNETKFEVQNLQHNSVNNANGIEECKENLKNNWKEYD